MLRRFKVIILILLCFILCTVAIAYYLYRSLISIDSYLIPQHEQSFVLKKGENAKNVAYSLLYPHYPHLVIDLWLYLHKDEDFNNIKKGEYAIDGQKTLLAVFEDMKEGRIVSHEYDRLTIIEGSTWPEVQARLQSITGTSDDSLEALDDPKLLISSCLNSEQHEFLGQVESLEGLLMAATYPVFDNKPLINVIEVALQENVNFLASQWDGRAETIAAYSAYEILIMASIIERETLVDEERAQIAAVFYNRLAKKMRLQTDPSVMYGVSPSFRGRLTRKMLRAASPYNTYLNAGLPPTPIGMPSKASILAALHPSDSEYLYFVAKDISPTKGHVFSVTLDEHNEAVVAYRQRLATYRALQAEGKADEYVYADELIDSAEDEDEESEDPELVAH